MKRLSSKTRFQVGAAAILVIVCAAAAVMVHYYLKNLVTTHIYRETEIFIGAADAIRNYVKDVLRPQVRKLLPPDGFIPQAMSTSYVGREIMARLHDRFPEFDYRRAARDPMNSINQADPFELKMLQWFREHPGAHEWHGLVQKSHRSYYTRLRAIYAEAECLVCHGNPADAPEQMKAIYGIDGGYHYRLGDVVAADTIYIPIDVSFVKVKEAAWLAFVFAITALLTLLGLFNLLFNRTVVSDLQGLLGQFQGISGSRPLPTLPEPIEDGRDEIEQLKRAFETVARDLKYAHDELKASESKYRRLFESSQDAVLIFNQETQLQDINEAGLKLFGFKNQDEALGIETFYQLFWEPRDARHFSDTVQRAGFVQDHEATMIDRHAKKLVVMISATTRLDENDQATGVDATFRDITEKRRLEKNLAQTEKLASMGQLAAGVAHEINNPLGVIKTYVNLIAKTFPDSDDSQVVRDLLVIRKHTDQCKSVIESLLSFARVSEPKKSPTDIHACMEEVLSVLEHQMKIEGITIRRVFGSNIPPLTLDVQQIIQVFMNLFMNARQAMEDGGQLTIATSMRSKNSILAVDITDTGKGIAPGDIGRIFDPFFTTKEAGQGTGLGLSVSYGIIKQHGGEIEVDSLPGRGSRFTILLPLLESPTNGD